MAFDPNKQLPGGPKDANEAFLDALIRHQIGLLRVGGSINKDIIAILNATEKQIAKEIRTRLSKVQDSNVSANLRRSIALQKILAKIRIGAWKDVAKIWKEELTKVTVAEPRFVDEALKRVTVVILPTTLPLTPILTNIVKNNPFEGKVLSRWATDISTTDISRINSQIQIGIVQGETGKQIARRVVGTAALKGKDGVTEISRRNAEAITRTAINSYSNQAKREYYLDNKDLFSEELYVATLDSRTTPICMSLDGQRFPVGKGPIPPQHFNCRSLRVAVLDGAGLSNRPAVASTEQQLLREFTSEQGISKVSKRSFLPRGTKGKFDEFSRIRKRELTGQVPGKTTYQQFLSRQPAAIQDDILGKTKGRLFRRGGLKLDRFVDRRGNELTLSQLATKEASAFRAAGLDPADF